MKRTSTVMKTHGEILGNLWGVRDGIKCVGIAALVAAQLLLTASAQVKGAEINLVVGEVKTISLPPNNKIIRIGIGNGKLFGAKVLEKEGG